MEVNKDPDVVVLNKDFYEKIMGELSRLRPYLHLAKQVGKHARKFNYNLAQSHKAKLHQERLQNQLLNKKLHILLRLRRQAVAKGEKFIVWRKTDYNLMHHYELVGVRHFGNAPSKRFLKLKTTRQTSKGSFPDILFIHIADVYVEWSDDVQSYTSAIIGAGMSLGLEPSVLVDKGYCDFMGHTVLVNDVYGLVGFQKEPIKEDNSCSTL